MGSVTVTPASFTMVLFDADRIRELATRLQAELGMGDTDVEVVVDEATPLTRAHVASADPAQVVIESGAIEDPKRPRQLSDERAVDVIGRLLLRVRDRRERGFADAPPDGELTPAEAAAWTAYAEGRLERLGHPAQQQRWRYHFRNRHGFTDAADAAFDRLWAADTLTWAELSALSAEAAAAAVPSRAAPVG
ncbi:MAG: hypothetical protein IPM45_11865 [Acidimicrobiales bacterium]|nr:hypothetical protein [Acidimicrobiales bacterium]